MNVLPFDRKSQVLSLLVEGCSIRSISRVTGTQKNTILKLLVDSGREAMEILDAQLINLKPRYVQVDEIWAYVGKKQKRVTDIDSPELGDQYVFVAMDSETKLAMSYLVGKRNYENALSIMKDLQYITAQYRPFGIPRAIFFSLERKRRARNTTDEDGKVG